jgi:hypothetical protein
MKAPIFGLIVSTTAFAGGSLYLFQQLREERARADEVTQMSRRLTARISELENARTDFAQRRFANAGGSFGGGASAQRGLDGPPPPAGEAGTAQADDEPHGPVWSIRPDRSPAFHKMMRNQLKANNKRMYADIGAALALNKDEASKLIELLTDQQAAGFGQTREVTDPADAARAQEERERRNQTEIADLIGTDKAESFEKYQESLPSRQELDMLARQLEGADASLNDDQRKRLLAVLIDERTAVPMPQFAEGMDGEQYGKSLNAWQEDYNERVASQARSIFNNDQLTVFDEYQQWQKEMREQFATIGPGVPRNFRGGSGPNVTFAVAAPGIGGVVASPRPPPEQKSSKKQ